MRILQITDCHLVAEPGREIYGVDPYRSLRAVLDAATRLADPPELVLATGDLSENGSAGSYERLRALLLDCALPVYVLAGNHDSVSGMRRTLVGGAIVMAAQLDLGRWRIVFLDSKVAGEPYGYLEAAELARLERLLADDPERPVLACLHHSPIRPCPTRWCHLRNDAELVRVLDRHANARVVVAGHSHLERERRVRHASLFTTPATSAQCVHAGPGDAVDHDGFWASHEFDPRRHAFRMLTLHAGGRFDTRVHWLDNERVPA